MILIPKLFRGDWFKLIEFYFLGVGRMNTKYKSLERTLELILWIITFFLFHNGYVFIVENFYEQKVEDTVWQTTFQE